MGAPKKRPAAPPQARSVPPDRWWCSRHLVAVALLTAATIAAFWNSFSAGFVLDNRLALLDDPRVRQATAENIGLIFHHTYWWPYGEAGLYRPLTTLSYLFNYAILGNRDDPAGYHSINFLLHWTNVILVYLLATRLIRRLWPAVFCAGLWAVHPLVTESVTNMVGRADLLAGTAVLGGFLIYLKSTEAHGSRRWLWLAALFLTGAAGFFSKESAVVLIGVIVLFQLAWWKERRQGRAMAWGVLSLLPPLAAMLYQRAVVLAASGKGDFPFTDNPIMGAGFWVGRLTAIEVIAKYLWLTVWPAKLSADYSYPQIPLASGTFFDWLAWIAVAAAIAAVICLYRVNRTAFFLACFAGLTLFPTSNIPFPIGTIMAERFMYLPLIGLLGCIVLGVYALGERLRNPHLAPVALAIAAAALCVRTWARNADWHDPISFATATVQAAPRSFKAHKLLAVALDESDTGDAQLDRAIAEARRSMELIDSLPPDRADPAIYRLAATLYARKGDYQTARAMLERSIVILQAVRRREGQPADAVPEFVNAETGRLLSAVYQQLGDTDKALRIAVQARRMEPLNAEMYRQLASVLLARNQVADAAGTLMEGMIVTQDMEIRRELLSVYAKGIDTKGCAVIQGPGGPAINPTCELVHQQMCAIAPDAIKVRLETGRRDIAEELRRSFLHDYGCPAGPIDAVLP